MMLSLNIEFIVALNIRRRIILFIMILLASSNRNVSNERHVVFTKNKQINMATPTCMTMLALLRCNYKWQSSNFEWATQNDIN